MALLVIMISHVATKRTVLGLYKQVEHILLICQTAAVLEVGISQNCLITYQLN